MLSRPSGAVSPAWVPSAAKVYLAHTEQGTSIRALARAAGCHASTVLRQIRKVEQRRDDPLIDLALRRLGKQVAPLPPKEPPTSKETVRGTAMKHTSTLCPAAPDDALIEREARRILRRLAEPGACLAVAAGMENAVVVRDGTDGQTLRTGVVLTKVAEAMALRGWIASASGGRVARYQLTPAGRQALKHLLDDAAHGPEDKADRPGRMRYGIAESPLIALARRRDRDGTPFLADVLVSAGERLREDFELAQMAPDGPQSWSAVVAGDGADTGGDPGGTTSEAARARVALALRELGPGLGDVVLRCCCQLEGMEAVERRMGWAARSGKIVLRIALQRLRRHYDEAGDRWSQMIG
ncbi:DUF6456 domain-containing protein [Oceaniovalibus sp. ACAM 378]|uniref:DUF6456 domain-containing protein n=1 Tax=Oceaniovalibus sp. ACAM 378 TaxID=2599923 RepID=UPI0011DAEBDD|nr:DUF6456 domain-containing protein [Oceaniovalibus sp. ACAM 378]TYB89383.1 helix-turn-helix domain-containing protein [Oceaniovalibus sp. ACAM 378]